MEIIGILISGLLMGGVYALMSSGLAIIFGVMNIVNLAHAAFIILGAYLSLYSANWFGIDPLLSVPINMVVMFGLGLVLYKLLFTRIPNQARFIEYTVLMTFAVALLFEGSMTYLFTGIFRSTNPVYATKALHIGNFALSYARIYATILSLVLLLGLYILLKTTKTGRAIRATMQDKKAAQVVGVNVQRISTITFGIGLSLAGASGALMSFLYTFYPSAHWTWIPRLLAIIVFGGLGSLKGAIIGSIILGTGVALVGNLVSTSWAPMVFFGVLFIVLLFKPEGLFGKKVQKI